MSFTRRSFLIGAGSGLSLLVLTACTDTPPVPTNSATPPPPTAVPEASSFFRSNWTRDPYARGATSYLPVGSLPDSRAVLSEPLLDRVFFAGEALSDAPGTIRGAQASGAATVSRVNDVAGEAERVAIIGAGAAGAEAARLLSFTGLGVVVLDARDRTGGRIDSRVAEGDVPIELGAWRLGEVADAEVILELERAGVETAALAGPSLFWQADEILEPDDAAIPTAIAAVTAATAWAGQQARDVSLADALVDSGATDDPPAPALVQQLNSVGALTGAEASAVSAWFTEPDLADPWVTPTGPLSTFIDAALEGVDTFLSTTVVGVAYDEEGVSLRLGTGESLSVDRVIVTAPLGVLQEQVIEFDPPLPLGYRGAINALGVGHVDLVRLDFDEPFWQTDATVWTLVDSDEAITTWVNLLPSTGRATLLGVVSGDAAVALAELDDDDVLAAARNSLTPFIP